MSKIYWSWTNLRGSIRRLWQNIRWGWNESECWDLEHSLSPIILSRLKQFKKMERHGIPAMFLRTKYVDGGRTDEERKQYDLDEQKGEREWEWVIDQMIWAFQYTVDENNDICSLKELEKYLGLVPGRYDMVRAYQYAHKKQKRGYRLFAKYLPNLWD